MRRPCTRQLASRVALWAAVSGGAACTAWVPPPVEPYWQGRLDVAEELFRERLDSSDGDWVLMANELATTLDAKGDVDGAWRLFYDAGRAMETWDASIGERVGTVVGREDTREYRGEPYERALNSIYTGILAFERGEPDNARASFKEAMLRDAEQSEEEFGSDFAPSFYLAAWASRDNGQASEARSFLQEARQARAGAVAHGARGKSDPLAFRNFESSNLLVLASVGRGPWKVARRDRPDMVVMASPTQRVRAARVFVDGVLRGTTEVIGDVDFQANTRGGRWLDGIREGKAVFKEVSGTAGTVLLLEGIDRDDKGLMLAGAIALLGSLFISVDPDLRCWRTLPDTLQAIALDVTPGEHTVFVEFIATDGRVDPQYSREYRITVPDRDAPRLQTTILHARSVPAPTPHRYPPTGGSQ
ncbi:MAG: tetratricopeptide repeat protein [Planctomycetes bacterium]|nr:tetratricopeptide repeat protein [Planctomycetota bacterium]